MALDASAEERLTRGIDLDDRVVGGVGRQRELDVAAALHAEGADDGERGGAESLVDRIGQRLDGRDDDGVARVDAQRVDVLHGAHGDAGVVRVAHHLVLDLLPAHETALDHDLADGAQAQAGPHRSRYASSVSTMPPPVPPSVNAGRMTAGSPISASARSMPAWRSSSVSPWMITEGAYG